MTSITGHVLPYSSDAMQKTRQNCLHVKVPEVQIALLTFVREILMGNKAHCEALERAMKCTSGMKPETEIHLSLFVIVS